MKTLEIYLDNDITRENWLVVNSRILMSNNAPIKIFISKNSALYFSEYIAIAIEYLHAAYIGERLSQITNLINLIDVLPQETGNIGFELIQPDKNALINLLEELIGYSDWDNDEDELNFMEQAQDFIEFAENNPIRFPELFERYTEFAKEAEEED
jgi:hypothetical protein